MQQSHRETVFGETKSGTFLWCLHCERTYEHGKWRNDGDLQMCPYADCNGDAVIDAWDWETVRTSHPEYPLTPTFGVHYPFYT